MLRPHSPKPQWHKLVDGIADCHVLDLIASNKETIEF